jgi:hypothetical protein
MNIQGGSNMTGTDLCVNKSQFVPVIFEPPYIKVYLLSETLQHLMPLVKRMQDM